MNKEKIQTIFLVASPKFLDYESTQTKNLQDQAAKIEKFILINFQKTKFKIEKINNILFIEIPRVKAFFYIPKIIKEIRKYINKDIKTVISAVNPYDMAILGILINKILKFTSLQIQIHFDLFSKYYIKSKKRHKLYFLISKITLPFASTIRTHSINTANILQKKYPKKIVKQIKEIANFSEIPITATKNTEGVLYLSPSRYDAQKNLFVLINAFTDFHKDYPETKLKIIGEGILEKQLKELIVKNNAENYIELPGWSKDMPNEYVRANFTILSSIFEGYSMVGIETLRYGTPFLATPVTGSTELVIDGENGYLAKGFSKKDILELLITSYKNKNNFDSEKIRETVKDFTKDNMDKELIELWKETR